ncbi:MAG: UbiA family prenyltransferase [Candidatus Aenigmatarchaeota archaeon]
MLGYVQLLRPLNCLMTAVAVFVGGLLVMGGAPEGLLTLRIAMLAAFLVAGGGNAINDYTDVEADKVNRPKRPIPSGRASKRGALAFSIALFVLGIVLAGMINWVTFFIALVNSVLLIAYSTHLQDKLLVGNAAISYLVGSGFLFGGAALGNLTLPFLLFLLAGLSNMSREIVKDLEDIAGDKAGFLKRLTYGAKRKVHSIADRFGVTSGGIRLKYGRRLVVAAGLSLALAIAVSPVPYMLGILGVSYLVILVPTDIVFLACIFGLAKGRGKKKYGRISKGIKLGMFLGLIAFLAGVFI